MTVPETRELLEEPALSSGAGRPVSGVFLQVRLDSRRFPGKALLPLADGTVTARVISALSLIPADYRVLLTDKSGAAELAGAAHNSGWRVYIGPKDDVLARFAGAIRHFKVDTVIRATGDNPLVSPELAREALDLFYARKADYCGLDEIPLGCGVEVVRAACLLEADAKAREPYEREHVTPYLYRRPEEFAILRTPASRRAAGRVSLDTPADYEKIKRIFSDLYRGVPVTLEELYAWLAKHER